MFLPLYIREDYQMNKKLKARMEMLRKLSKDKGSDLHSGLGESLKGKKLSKVEVIAKDDKGLADGLSKAQQILKAKLGEKALESDKEEESEESSDEYADGEECEACEGKGCEACSDEEMEEA